jgi:hypothetical protein
MNTYAAHWYENGKKVRQYFSVARYGEEHAKQLVIEPAWLQKGAFLFMLRHFITAKSWYKS